MLTKDLLRHRLGHGTVTPQLLKATPSIVELTTAILAHWNGGIGGRLGDLEDAAMPILHQTKSLLVAKGLQKLILDECRFADAASAVVLREQAFAHSARLLAKAPPTGETHRAAVAQAVGLSADALQEGLYADLPDFARLEAGCSLGVPELIGRYNLAQCQGLLLTAKELTVTIHDSDTALRRKLLANLRFRRLLAEVAGTGTALTLIVSGPGSVLDQAARYGMNLALFLPALACCRRWNATAWVQPARTGAPLELALSDETGLVGDSRLLGHVPEEVTVFAQTLATACPEWRLAEPEPIQLPGGELVVPDLCIVAGGVTTPVELFHRWHANGLTRRLAQLAKNGAPRLLIGVDRAVAKRPEFKGLDDHPAFAARGFRFSEMPTVRVLKEAVERSCVQDG